MRCPICHINSAYASADEIAEHNRRCREQHSSAPSDDLASTLVGAAIESAIDWGASTDSSSSSDSSSSDFSGGGGESGGGGSSGDW